MMINDRARDYVVILGWLLAYILVAGSFQLYIPYPQDGDTAYHAAVGNLMRQHGILEAFPWTPFSWLADHYADKELLFHLLFVPLGGMDWISAARVVGTLVGATMLFALYLILRAEGVRYAGLWALLPLVASAVFTFRFVLVRPHVLSVALALVVLWSAARGRLLILAAASAIYPWAYVAWELPLLLVLASEVARLLSGEGVRWKPMAATIGGLAVGLALHPNAVNLVRLSWIVIMDVLIKGAWGLREGIELGQEFKPFSLGQWLQWMLVCTVMAAGALVIAWRHRRSGSTPLAFSFAALGFGVLTAASARFTEYFVPFSVAAMALSSRHMPWRFLVPAILTVSTVYSVALGSEQVTLLAIRRDDIIPPVQSALRQRVPPGAQVFTCEWGMTGRQMLALPDRRFMVALDPTLFYIKDPDLYRLWYTLPREAPPGSADIIRQRFGAQYVLCVDIQDWSAFFDRLMSEQGVSMLLAQDIWILFDLGPPQPPILGR